MCGFKGSDCGVFRSAGQKAWIVVASTKAIIADYCLASIVSSCRKRCSSSGKLMGGTVIQSRLGNRGDPSRKRRKKPCRNIHCNGASCTSRGPESTLLVKGVLEMENLNGRRKCLVKFVQFARGKLYFLIDWRWKQY